MTCIVRMDECDFWGVPEALCDGNILAICFMTHNHSVAYDFSAISDSVLPRTDCHDQRGGSWFLGRSGAETIPSSGRHTSVGVSSDGSLPTPRWLVSRALFPTPRPFASTPDWDVCMFISCNTSLRIDIYFLIRYSIS